MLREIHTFSSCCAGAIAHTQKQRENEIFNEYLTNSFRLLWRKRGRLTWWCSEMEHHTKQLNQKIGLDIDRMKCNFKPKYWKLREKEWKIILKFASEYSACTQKSSSIAYYHLFGHDFPRKCSGWEHKVSDNFRLLSVSDCY